MNCLVCGTSIKAGEVECSTCGATVALSDVIPSADQLAKLGVLRESEPLDELLRHTPSGWNWVSASLGEVAVGLLIIIMAIVTVFLFGSLGPFLRFVLGLFFVLGGAGLIVQALSCLAELADSPLERLSAVVMGKIESPTRIPGIHWHHLALLTTTQGKKAVRARGASLKRVQKGDVGVAYLRADYLLDFKQVTLPGT